MLLVSKRDRLARDGDQVVFAEFAIGQRGAKVVSVKEERANGTDAASVFMRRMLDAASELARNIGRERTRDALKAKARRGERTGEVPFGWDLATDGAVSRKNKLVTTLVENSDEQAIIAQMRRWRSEGVSLRGIAKRLMGLGIKTKTEILRRVELVA